MTDDARFMAVALDEAAAALGTTAPNPSVGAVVVRDGIVLGVGRTQPVGGPHAEVMALRAAALAGHDVTGATMYVTLEPCRHVGRTPPCTRAILDAGIARVVVGVVDPFPPMRGQALAELRQAGVAVELGVGATDAARTVRGFTRVIQHGLPEVTLKVACSLDGHIATRSGESRWITGAEARRDGHRLRASHDAIVVGIGTLLADDPRLTTRDVDGSDPVPVVFDSRCRTPPTAAVFEGTRRPIVVCVAGAERDLPGDVVGVPAGPGGVDVEAALRELAGRGLHRVLVEGGGTLARSLLDARLVDEVVLYQAPLVIPGGRPWIGGPPIDALADAPRWTLRAMDRLGPDVVLRYDVPHRLAEA